MNNNQSGVFDNIFTNNDNLSVAISRNISNASDSIWKFDIFWYILTGVISAYKIITSETYSASVLYTGIVFALPIIIKTMFKWDMYKNLKDIKNKKYVRILISNFLKLLGAAFCITIIMMLLIVNHIVKPYSVFCWSALMLDDILYLVVGLGDLILWRLLTLSQARTMTIEMKGDAIK